jgi:hypothetical protein
LLLLHARLLLHEHLLLLHALIFLTHRILRKWGRLLLLTSFFFLFGQFLLALEFPASIAFFVFALPSLTLQAFFFSEPRSHLLFGFHHHTSFEVVEFFDRDAGIFVEKICSKGQIQLWIWIENIFGFRDKFATTESFGRCKD